MGLFYQRNEKEEEVVICFKYMWLLWILILISILFSFLIKNVIIAYTPLLFAIIYLVDTMKVRSEIKNAMKKEGVKFQGSKFSISNPLTAIIKKKT